MDVIRVLLAFLTRSLVLPLLASVSLIWLKIGSDLKLMLSVLNAGCCVLDVDADEVKYEDVEGQMWSILYKEQAKRCVPCLLFNRGI